MARVGGGAGADWSQEETILAYALLKVHGLSAPAREIDELAQLLDRSAGSVRRKLANLRSAETAGAEGLPHRSHIDDEVVARFGGREMALRAEAKRIRAV